MGSHPCLATTSQRLLLELVPIWVHAYHGLEIFYLRFVHLICRIVLQENRVFFPVLCAFNKEPVANANHLAARPATACYLPHKFYGSV